MNDPTHTRRQQLARALRESGVDAFLAWHPLTLGFLQGFREGAGERFLALAVRDTGETLLIAPALSETQARRAGVEDVRAWRDGENPLALVRDLSQQWDLKTGIIAVDDEMPSAMLLQLQNTLPAALFRPGGALLGTLTRGKDAEALRAMRAAATIADEAFAEVCGQIAPGQTELDVESMLREAMRNRGGLPTFAIVAGGALAAEPHHLSEAVPLPIGAPIIMDFGCEVDGYQSDITRTVALGTASERAHHVYGVVRDAALAARAAIRPGVPAQTIDAAARQVIEAAGFGEAFFHRVGHGIGMRVHEPPYIVGDNAEPVLEGDCFSIEPGIYLAGELGVRIENIVTVTADGHESLNVEPPAVLMEL